MVEIRDVAPSDLAALRELHNASTDSDMALSAVRDLFEETPELFVGAFEEGTLVGYCLGLADPPDDVQLGGIGVREPFRHQGIGSALLQEFEDRVAALGYERVSLGTARGTVGFYLVHGYTPHSIRVTPGGPAAEYRDLGYELLDETVDGGSVVMHVAVEAYDSDLLPAVREAFDDPDAIYIMEKTFDPRS